MSDLNQCSFIGRLGDKPQMRTTHLLIDRPEGLSLPFIQSNIGMSVKTAQSILNAVAVCRDGKYYLRK